MDFRSDIETLPFLPMLTLNTRFLTLRTRFFFVHVKYITNR